MQVLRLENSWILVNIEDIIVMQTLKDLFLNLIFIFDCYWCLSVWTILLWVNLSIVNWWWIKISVSIIISKWKYFAPIGMLYNILLPINCYTGNITTKCHSKSMSDNRDLTGTFHQVSSLPVSIASDSIYFQSSWICFSVTKYSILQLPIEAVYI